MNENPSQFLQNMFKGTVKPIKRRMAAQPAFNQSVIIGKDGDLFSRARVWVYEPSYQYPEISIMFQLKNASGSCFTKLTLNDLQELQGKLNDWITGIQTLLPGLETKLASVNAYIDQYNQYADLVNQMRESNEKEESYVSDEPDDDPPEIVHRPNPRNRRHA